MKNRTDSVFEGVKSLASIEAAPESLFLELGDDSALGMTLVAFSAPFLGGSFGAGKSADTGTSERDINHGKELLLSFAIALCDPLYMPDVIVFYHRGVDLLSYQNPAAEIFQKLNDLGARILVCEESCKLYDVDISVVGIQNVSMETIYVEMLHADKVIKP